MSKIIINAPHWVSQEMGKKLEGGYGFGIDFEGDGDGVAEVIHHGTAEGRDLEKLLRDFPGGVTITIEDGQMVAEILEANDS